MKLGEYKKYLILITYAMVLAFVMFHISGILNAILTVFTILTPVWIGVILAFILNVPVSIIEREIFGHTSKGIRVFSIITSIMIVVLILTVLFVWIIPDFIESATYLVGQIPTLVETFNSFLVETFKNTDLSEYLKDFSGTSEIANLLSSVFRSAINNFTDILSNFVTFVIDLITGIIIAVYFLFAKEKILGMCQKFVKKTFNQDTVNSLSKVYKLSNKSLHDFITYQCLECLILGSIMFVAFLLFNFPYALTIAFLTAITAIIPFLGATIACVIGAILIGTFSVKQAIVFVIVFQVIQQIENNIIYPKVVGEHVGLPPIITIVALIIGGKVAGFLGMLLCIPITSIVYSLFKMKIEEDEKEEKAARTTKRLRVKKT